MLGKSAGYLPAKESNLGTLSNSTKELYQSLRSDLIGIHYRRLLVRQLFTSDDTNDLLNQAALRFFTTLKWDLLDTIAIMISRLTDPATSFNKNNNASLKQFVDSLDSTDYPELIRSLTDIHAEIKSKSGRIENWRKKWAGHRDLDVVQGLTPKPAMSVVEIDEVLELIGKFLNEFQRVCQEPVVEINHYGKSVSEVKEIAENELLRIGPPIDYENMLFQDDGRTIIDLITRAKSLS